MPRAKDAYCTFAIHSADTETGYRRDEKVIRHMVVKLDKYAVQYAEKRKHKWTKKLEEA